MPVSRFQAGAAMALMTLIWGTTWAAIRISLEGFPPFKGVAVRFAVAAVILLLLARLRGVRFGGQRYERRLWLLQAGFTFSASYGLVYWAEQWVPSGLTSVLYSSLPLWVTLFAYFVLPGERLRPIGLLGMLFGFAGIAVIFSEDFSQLGGPQVARAAAWLLLAPLLGAVAQVCVKRWGLKIHPLSLTAVPMALTALGMGALGGWLEADRPIVLAPAPVLATLYLAVGGTAITFGLFFWLLQHVSATRMSLIAYAVPVVAVTVGTLFMDEVLTARMVIGSALVIGGVAFAARPGRERGEAEKRP